MSETELSRAIQQALAMLPGVLLVRVQAGRVGRCRLACAGTPDLLGSVDGHAFAIEVKSEGGVCSTEQLLWHLRWRQCGGIVAVVSSVGDAMLAVQGARKGKAA